MESILTVHGESMSEARHGLAAVERQQANIASHPRAPGWYLALYGLGTAAFVVAQPLRIEYRAGSLAAALQILGTVVLCSPAFVRPRVTGVRLLGKTMKTYPSTMRGLPWLVVSLVAGIAAAAAGALSSLTPVSFAAAVATGVATAFALRGVYQAMSYDIVSGNLRR